MFCHFLCGIGDGVSINVIFYLTGGEAHTDVHGVHYSQDPLTDREIGTASDFGRSLIIARVPPADQVFGHVLCSDIKNSTKQ